MTIKKLFESELCADSSSRALNNCFEHRLEEECETLSEAILLGFSWNKSNEGFMYWYEIFLEALKYQKLKVTS